MVGLSQGGLRHKLCADTGCTMSLIDTAFLMKHAPKAEIKRMPTPMNVRGLGDKRHDASEYTKLEMYSPGDKGTAVIERELHIVDNLSADVLIGVDILKPEGMVIDLDQNILTIRSCEGLSVPINVSSRGSRINSTVYSEKAMIIAPHTNRKVTITGPRHRSLDLPHDREFLFEPEKVDKLSAYAHVVDCDMSHIIVRNDSEEQIKLPRNVKLGKVIEYEAAGCFPVEAFHSDLAVRPPRKNTNWVKSNLRRLVAAAAAFSAAIPNTPAPDTETVHNTGVTIHGSPQSRSLLGSVVDKFPSLWQDTGNVTNVPESQWMDIPLVDNWQDLYKPGQARVYPVRKADKEVIDDAFDKLHEQGRMEWTSE